MTREIKFFEAVYDALDLSLTRDERCYLMGLGVPDPKGIFGTTLGLQEKHGSKRVFDMPTSENAMTGIAIGSAIRGMRPIMSHQRLDFFLLALDQLINNAAKWHYMFAGQASVPLVIRLIIGRGWGQGPQHSQSLHSLFAHIPGIKVVAPATPYDAKGLLTAAIEDNNPVIYLEHRWLHGNYGIVPKEYYTVPIGKAKILSSGKNLTLVASSHMTIEALRCKEELLSMGIDAEIIDIRSLKPLDTDLIFESIKKTGHLLVLDDDWKFSGFAAEVIASAVENVFCDLKTAPKRVTYPDSYPPTSWALSNHFYPSKKHIIHAAAAMLGKQLPYSLTNALQERQMKPLDVPDKAFTGPF